MKFNQAAPFTVEAGRMKEKANALNLTCLNAQT